MTTMEKPRMGNAGEEKPVSARVFVMPRPELGMSVLWYPDGVKRLAHPAFVTGIGYDSLCLNIMAPNTYNFTVRDGVRHCDDPRLKSAEQMESGTWDFTPFMKKLFDLTGMAEG